MLLQEELSGRVTKSIFLQEVVERLQAQEPSPRARDLAAQIPLDADPYALALKAIAESRFDEARSLLGEAEKAKEIELARFIRLMVKQKAMRADRSMPLAGIGKHYLSGWLIRGF